MNWESECMGDTYDWNSEGMEGFKIWNFHRGQTRVYSLKTHYNLMDFYYNRFENKARTDEDADTHGSRIQDKHPPI